MAVGRSVSISQHCSEDSFPGGCTRLTGVTSSHREEDLADVDTGDSAVGLAESATHSGLQSIGTSARQHLVDADDVVWVSADTEVETFLSGSLDHVPDSLLVSQSVPLVLRFLSCS